MESGLKRLVATVSLAGVVGLAGLAIAIFGLVQLLSHHTTEPSMAASSTLHVGSAAPLEGTLERLGPGGSVELSSLRNKGPIVINFFASWCQACAGELAAFATVGREEAGKVRFLGIDTNDDDEKKALALVTRAGTTYTVLTDTTTLGLSDRFGIENLPTTFFIGSDGRVKAAAVGLETVASLRTAISGLVPVASK